MKLTYPQKIQDPSSTYLLELRHYKLEVDENFELTQTVRCEYFADSETSLYASINSDETLTPEQKKRKKEQFKPFTKEASTKGHRVDATTLELVQQNQDGTWPENSIPENEAWFYALAADAPGSTMGEKVQALLLQSMGKMINRGRI